MGSRLGVIIRSENGWKLYYDLGGVGARPPLSGSPESIRPPLIEAGSARRRSPDGSKFISPWDEFRPAFARQQVRLPEGYSGCVLGHFRGAI